MKILRLLLIFYVISIVLYAESQAPTSHPWNPAMYRGLIMGKSTRAEVIKVLGKPKWDGKEEYSRIPMMSYEVDYPMPGTLYVYMTKGILESMTLSLKKKVNQNEIIRLFGSNYVVVHYATDECFADGESVPIYQKTNGPIKTMQYRNLGLVADFDYNSDDTVYAITYIYKRSIRTHSSCSGQGKEK